MPFWIINGGSLLRWSPEWQIKIWKLACDVTFNLIVHLSTKVGFCAVMDFLKSLFLDSASLFLLLHKEPIFLSNRPPRLLYLWGRVYVFPFQALFIFYMTFLSMSISPRLMSPCSHNNTSPLVLSVKGFVSLHKSTRLTSLKMKKIEAYFCCRHFSALRKKEVSFFTLISWQNGKQFLK